jgi:hypothetical protein
MKGDTVFRVILTVIAISVALPVNAQRLSAPSQRVMTDSAFLSNSIPKWEHGFLMGIDYTRASVFAADRSGKVVMQSRVWPPDAEIVHVHDIAASPRGSFAVVASAMKGGVWSSFIEWIGVDGTVTKLVRTTPAHALRICFADDGTLWAVVKVQDENGLEPTNYDLLRHYDQNGILVGTAVSREHFKHRPFPDGDARLTASHDRIGLCIPKLRMWIEVSTTGGVLGHWILPENNYKQYEVFLSPANNVYVSHESRPLKPGDTMIAIDRFDKNTGTLSRVDASQILDPGETHLRLFGFDGEDAIVSKTLVYPVLLRARGL